MLQDKPQLLLNDVLIACEHAADQYRETAEFIHDRPIAELFFELAARREHIAMELEAHLRAMGELPREADPDREAVTSLLTRAKAKLAHDERSSAIAEADKTEERLAGLIDHALEADLPAAPRTALERLRADAAATRQQLDSMMQGMERSD